MTDDKANFNELVDMAMANSTLAAMRPVVEKELLHYEIFHALNADGLLKDLVFQGGTSLRLCRGSARFSEDLDFAGGTTFTAADMGEIKTCLERRIKDRFNLNVTVNSKGSKIGADGIADVRVEKWWISIETAPQNPSMPRQRIKLEITNIPAHTRELVPIQDNYGFLGGSVVLVNAETLDEIMADKILAFPTSLLDNQGKQVKPDSNKIRHRDLWDLAWMSTQRARLKPSLVVAKIADYALKDYPELLARAIEQIPLIVTSREFRNQMARFIDSATLGKTLDHEAYLDYLASSVGGLFSQMQSALNFRPEETQQISSTASTEVKGNESP